MRRSDAILGTVAWFLITGSMVSIAIFGLHAVIEFYMQMILIFTGIVLFILLLIYIFYRIDRSYGLIEEKRYWKNRS